MAMSFQQQREQMVEKQLKRRGIKDKRVLAAFMKVPRELFVEKRLQKAAYDDRPLPIGEEQTISQPYIVAYMLEKLQISPGDRVLEVGSGCGYVLALLAEIAKEVYGLERREKLGQQSRQTLSRLGYDRVEVKIGDGTKGWREKAPFAKILVSAASAQVPQELKEQLKVSGKMILPLSQGFGQRLVLLTKRNQDSFSRRKLQAVRFVPLIAD